MKKNVRKLKYEHYVLMLVPVVALIGLAVYLIESRLPSKTYEDLGAYFSLENDDEAAIVINGELNEEKALIDNGEYYLKYDMVRSDVNKRLYYDDTENLFCVATPTELHTFDLTELEKGASVITKDNDLYVSLTFLKSWSDFETIISDEPERLVLTTQWNYETVTVRSEECIRVKASIKGNILHTAEAGETLRLMSSDEVPDGWKKVSTKDGLTGYLRSAYLEDETVIQGEPVSLLGEYTTVRLDQDANVAFYQSDNPSMNTTLTDKLEKVSGVNVICPTWFFLDGPGEVTVNFDQEFVDICHERGYQVWALLNDIDGQVTDSEGTFEALRGTSDRQRLIQTMLDTALTYQIDGINVDLEHVSQDGVYAYLEFIRELSIGCRQNGLILSVDTYVPMNYSLYLDRTELGKVADYVIVMCYDEHYSGSEEAGSVSSLNFLENGLERTLREVPAQKIIAAIPFYTRLWSESGGSTPDSRIMTMKEASDYVSENQMEVFWDEETGQHLAELEENGRQYQIWLEDADSVEAKMKKISGYHIGGVAEWCLGEETEDVWGVISRYLNLEE